MILPKTLFLPRFSEETTYALCFNHTFIITSHTQNLWLFQNQPIAFLNRHLFPKHAVCEDSLSFSNHY